MRTLIGRITNSDPTTFVTTFAVWALLLGTALIWTENYYNLSPGWDLIRVYIHSDTVLGWMMVIDAALLIAAVRFQRDSYRTVITLCSGLLWGLLGIALTYSAYQKHILSVVGIFSLWCSMQAIFAVGRWQQAEYRSHYHVSK